MKFWIKLRTLIAGRRLEREMSDEMEAHINALTKRHLAKGMSPEEARYAALRAFGGVEQIKERARDERKILWLEQLWQDVRYAVRALWKSPGFTVVAIISLAVGIGANTAIFSAVNATVLKHVPVGNPDGLVQFQWQAQHDNAPKMVDWNMGADFDPASGTRTGLIFSAKSLSAFQQEEETLSGVTAIAMLLGSNVVIDQQAETVMFGQLVSGNYYQVLEVPALRGRTILPADDLPGAPPVCVISQHYWQTRFAGDPAVVGKTILVNRVPATIIGITPSGFPGSMQIGHDADITLPLSLAAQLRRDGSKVGNSDLWRLRIIGRLAPGVSRAQAQARLEGVFQQSARDDLVRSQNDALPRLLAVSGDRAQMEFMRRSALRQLVPMMWMVGLLLLAGCANVANLLLARGAARRREIAVRLALGVGRGRLIRQLLTEGLILAFLGAGLGMLLAQWGLQLFASLTPAVSSGYGSLFQEGTLHLNGRVLGFTTLIAVLTGILFSLAPTLRSTRLDLAAEFQSGTRSLGSAAVSRLSQLLVVVQVAVSVVLLICSVLFVRVLWQAGKIELGFQPNHRLMFAVDAQGAGYKPEQGAVLYHRLAESLEALPGVRSASFSAWPVLTGEGGPFFGVLEVPEKHQKFHGVMWNASGPNFFKSYGMPLLQGRGFGPHDNAKAPQVAVVNQTFAQRYFDRGSALGHHVIFLGDREVIGVVPDARLTVPELRSAVEPQVFVPFAQSGQRLARFVVHTETDPMSMLSAIKNVVSKTDANVAMIGVCTQAEQVAWRFLGQRMLAWLAGSIGLMALGLVSVGIYGLMSYAVHRRTSEIGVRLALGALPQRVLWMVIRESLTIILAGLVAGIALACGVTQFLASMLLDLSPTDPLTYGAVALFLTAVALFACWLPARRAAKVDPMVSLRCE